MDTNNIIEEIDLSLANGASTEAFLQLKTVTIGGIGAIVSNPKTIPILTKWISSRDMLNAIIPYLQQWVWYRTPSAGYPLLAISMVGSPSFIEALFQQLNSEIDIMDQLSAAKLFDSLANMEIPEGGSVAEHLISQIPFDSFMKCLIPKLTIDGNELSIFIAGIFHGFAKYLRFQFVDKYSNFVEDTIAPIMKGIIDSTEVNHKGLQVQLILTIAHLVGNEEDSLLTKYPESLKNLVAVLEQSICHQQYGVLEYGVSGVLDGISRTVISDSNKSVYLSTNLTELLCFILCIHSRASPMVNSVLQSLSAGLSLEKFDQAWFTEGIATKGPRWSWRPPALLKILHCLEQMCFFPKVQSFLVGLNVPRLLELYLNSSTEEVQKSANMLYWKLTNESFFNADYAPPPDKGASAHVMISYSWKNKEVARQIANFIQANGFRIWIDIHHMHGSIMEAMADAVENAQLILVCMSKPYKESVSCRLEAEYAMQRRKPIIPIMMEEEFQPNGWLGFMLGQKKYFNAFDSTSFLQDAPSLLKEICKYLQLPAIPGHISNRPHMASDAVFSSNSKENSATQKLNTKHRTVSQWTTQNVAEWLSAADLAQYIDAFKEAEVDGVSLVELRELLLKETTVQFGYSFIESKLGIKKGGHLLRFVNRLKMEFL